jgi:hypothetical protein
MGPAFYRSGGDMQTARNILHRPFLTKDFGKRRGQLAQQELVRLG